MFHVIPISSGLTISTTPLGAKSISHLFFEAKGDGLFRFKSSPDTISISIDGRQICRDLLVLPFCTSSPCSADRFPWQKVALEVNVNCNLSEVRIMADSWQADYNVIMVCSDEEVDESRGFDFFETKRISLRKTVSASVVRKIIAEAFDEAVVREMLGGAQDDHIDYKDKAVLWRRMNERSGVAWRLEPKLCANGDIDMVIASAQMDGKRYAFPVEVMQACAMFTEVFKLSMRQTAMAGGLPVFRISGTPTITAENIMYVSDTTTSLVEEAEFSVVIDGETYSTADYCKECGVEGVKISRNQIGSAVRGMTKWVRDKALSNSDFFDSESVFRFDHTPTMMFAYDLARVASPLDDKKDDLWLHCDYPLTLSLSGTEREILEPQTDLELFTANDRIPMRDALLTFAPEDCVKRSISVSVGRRCYAGLQSDITKRSVGFTDWTLFFLFGYKKIV